MSRTDKDAPFEVQYPREAKNGLRFFDLGYVKYGSDSGFRRTRRWLKRQRSKSIRRYTPETCQNGAKAPYNGMKRTWDFE